MKHSPLALSLYAALNQTLRRQSLLPLPSPLLPLRPFLRFCFILPLLLQIGAYKLRYRFRDFFFFFKEERTKRYSIPSFVKTFNSRKESQKVLLTFYCLSCLSRLAKSWTSSGHIMRKLKINVSSLSSMLRFYSILLLLLQIGAYKLRYRSRDLKKKKSRKNKPLLLTVTSWQRI